MFNDTVWHVRKPVAWVQPERAEFDQDKLGGSPVPVSNHACDSVCLGQVHWALEQVRLWNLQSRSTVFEHKCKSGQLLWAWLQGCSLVWRVQGPGIQAWQQVCQMDHSHGWKERWRKVWKDLATSQMHRIWLRLVLCDKSTLKVIIWSEKWEDLDSNAAMTENTPLSGWWCYSCSGSI